MGTLPERNDGGGPTENALRRYRVVAGVPDIIPRVALPASSRERRSPALPSIIPRPSAAFVQVTRW
ncbi:hypothetical protein ACUH9O_03585 [Dermabacteraceae bacterium P13103]